MGSTVTSQQQAVRLDPGPRRVGFLPESKKHAILSPLENSKSVPHGGLAVCPRCMGIIPASSFCFDKVSCSRLCLEVVFWLKFTYHYVLPGK